MSQRGCCFPPGKAFVPSPPVWAITFAMKTAKGTSAKGKFAGKQNPRNNIESIAEPAPAKIEKAKTTMANAEEKLKAVGI